MRSTLTDGWGRFWAGSWVRKARRLAVSVFVTLHLSATFIYIVPQGPLRTYGMEVAKYYILPLGLWQYWGMFAPDPMNSGMSLEAQVYDSRGLRHEYAFPKVMDYSIWRGMPRFRHSKYAAILMAPDEKLLREIAARHVLRQLALPGAAYPVDVHLLFQAHVTSPPNSPPADPMTPPQHVPIETFHFANAGEVVR